MFLGNRIKELRDENQLLQRHLAAELEIDTPMYSKFERGERRPKREQVIKMAKIFNVKQEELISLWLAGQILEVVKDESEALNALEIVKQLFKD